MELIAKEGYVYALKTDNSVYGKKIDIGVNDSPDNWIEIPEKEIEDTIEEKI